MARDLLGEHPVAVVALVLIAISKPVTEYRPARMDYRGLVLLGSRHRAQHLRLPTVGPVGVDRHSNDFVRRRRGGDPGRVRARLLLPERVRADRTRQVGFVGQPDPPVLLPRFRGRCAGRRPNARPDRCEATGRARMRARFGRLRAVGRKGHGAPLRLPDRVRDHGRRGYGLDNSGLRAPTPSTEPRGSRTERRRVSPRPCATTQPASAWRSSGA